jgi:Transposase DNA-binding
MSWAAEQFATAELGDKRLNSRLVRQVAIKLRADSSAAQTTRPHIRRYHYEDRYNAGWKNVLTGISAVVFDGKGQGIASAAHPDSES